MTAVQIIQTICSALADSPSLSSYVQMARESLDRCFFSKMYEYAVAYKACHLFTIYGDNGVESSIAGLGGGAVTGLHEGGLSVNFTGSTSDDSELNSTKYGRMLKGLMKGGRRMNVNRNVFPFPQLMED